MCGVLIICADRACTKGKRNFNNRGRLRLPCVKGFASVRSTLAGLAETSSMRLPCVRGGGPRSGGRDLRVHAVLLQASPRRVRKPRSGWRDLRVCEARLQASPRRVVKNNPSPPAAELPLHKGAKNTPFQSTRAAGAPFLFDFLSSFFSPLSGLSFLKNAEIFIIFFVGARLSLTTPRFGAII